MDISYYIIYALLTNKVSGDFLSQQVVGVIGRSTILPCFFSDNGNKHTDINVRWRHNGTLNVCDITDGKCSGERQEPDYKNRAKVFPEEFVKGNFSLKLSNLTATDAGEYQCFIIHSSELIKVQLLLNESTADKGDTAANKEDTTANKRDPTTETTLMLQILLPVFIVGFLLLVCFIIFKYLKRRYKTSGSGVSAYGGHLFDNGSCQPLSITPEPANQNHQDFSGLQTNI
ncbi:ICOS ligand-like [Paramisgurnus dabryanus]|uniref:ICOS ligand-like n=1 Tax=Paramisgurnus dabryanus TaxID=90735 RepID=UPI0031F39C21